MDAERSERKPAGSSLPASVRKIRGINADAPQVKTVSFDEMWTYLGVRRGKKRRSAWIWTAVVEERDGSRRSDCEVGRRDMATFLRLLRRLPKAAKYRSDRYEAYSVPPLIRHVKGKGSEVNRNEGLHAKLRVRPTAWFAGRAVAASGCTCWSDRLRWRRLGTVYTNASAFKEYQIFPDERPDACEHCGSPILTKHGTADKPVTDLYIEKVTVVRYRRSDCGSAFRQRPEGVDRSGQTRRMRGWAALAWALCLSPRSASHLLAAFGVSVSRMSVWREVQEAGRNARRKQAGRAARTGDRHSADETVVRVKGETTFVGVVTDAATGEVLGLDVLVERDSTASWSGLAIFARDYGVEAIASDDLNTYKPVVERLGLDHQICIAHMKKRARKRLDRIEGWDWVKARIWRLLTEPPPSGGLELLRLERAVRDGDAALRRLRMELSGKWRAPLCRRRRRDVPWTNNVTERATGRSKILRPPKPAPKSPTVSGTVTFGGW